MADLSDLKIQLTLTMGEMRTLVSLINYAREALGEELPEYSATLIDEVSGMYFELMENVQDGRFDDFEPE